MNVSDVDNSTNSVTRNQTSATVESKSDIGRNSNRYLPPIYVTNVKKANNSHESSENVTLLPGKEHIIRVTRKYAGNVSSEETIGKARDTLQSSIKEEEDYSTANVTVRKKHMISRKHHHHHHHQQKSRNLHSSTQNKGSCECCKHCSKPSSRNSSIKCSECGIRHSEYCTRAKAKYRGYHDFFDTEHGKSSDEFGTLSGENQNDGGVTTPNIVESDDQDIPIRRSHRGALPKSNLFVPKPKKHKQHSYWDRNNYSRSMGSLNKTNLLTQVETYSPVLCRNCQQNTCPQCLQVIQNSVGNRSQDISNQNRQMSSCESTYRRRSYSSSHPILIQCANHGSCCHTHERLPVRHRLLPSWSMFQATDGINENVINSGSSKLEIEFIQGDDEDAKMFLTTEQLSWISKQAAIHIAEIDDMDSLAKKMKRILDQKFGEVWHSIVGPDSYGSNISTLPGYLVSFVVNKHAFLFWKT